MYHFGSRNNPSEPKKETELLSFIKEVREGVCACEGMYLYLIAKQRTRNRVGERDRVEESLRHEPRFNY